MSPENRTALSNNTQRRIEIATLGVLAATSCILTGCSHLSSATLKATSDAGKHNVTKSYGTMGVGGYAARPEIDALGTGSWIKIHVLTTSGAPVTGAVVSGLMPLGAYTNSDGMIADALNPGKRVLSIKRLPAGYHITGPTTKSISIGRGETADVTFRVSGVETDRVTGDVIGPDGKPVPGAVLQLCSVKDQAATVSGPAEWGRFDVRTHPLTPEGRLSNGVAVSDKNGHFAIDADWLNNARLLWASSGATDAALPGIRVVNGGHYTLKVQSDVMGALKGTLADGSGKPVSGAKVALIRMRAQGSKAVSPPVAITDAGGSYEIDSIPTEGTYAIHIEAAKDRSADYPALGSSAANIMLRPGETQTIPPIVLTK